MVRYHVLGTGDRKRRDRRATGQRFELNHAKRVGEAREHEHVGRGEMRGEVLPGLLAEEDGIRIFAFELGLLRSIADHDLGARQIQRQERFEILLHRDAAHGHEDRSRQIELSRMIGIEQFGIDAARPEAELAKTAFGQFLAERDGRDHRHGASGVEAAQDPVADAGRLGDAAAHVIEPDAAEQPVVAPVQDVEGVAAVLVPVDRRPAQAWPVSDMYSTINEDVDSTLRGIRAGLLLCSEEILPALGRCA